MAGEFTDLEDIHKCLDIHGWDTCGGPLQSDAVGNELNLKLPCTFQVLFICHKHTSPKVRYPKNFKL